MRSPLRLAPPPAPPAPSEWLPAPLPADLSGIVAGTTLGGLGCPGCGWHKMPWAATFSGMTQTNGAVPAAMETAAVVFPAAFVWTKMQAEAGQGLTDIVRRKELERTLGAGQFWWGIGNPLGENLTRLVARDPAPPVLFSIMRGRPKREDTTPDAVVAWTAYLDASGRLAPLPAQVLVTSRASTAGGDKRRHYALVCRADRPLALATLGELDATHYRNLGSEAPRVGASQVTAVVEHVDHAPPSAGQPGAFAPTLAAALAGSSGTPAADAGTTQAVGQRYEVNLRATLEAPYFVRLARPVQLASEDRAALSAAVPPADVHGWGAFVHALRARLDAQASQAPSDDLFSWYL